MKTLSQTNSVHHRVVLLASVMVLVAALPITVSAQDATTKDGPRANHTSGNSIAGDQSLAAQIRELQTKVAELGAALKQKHAGEMGSGMQGGSMRGMRDQGMGKKSGMGMASMSGQGTSGMGRGGMGTSGMGMGGTGMMSGEKGMMSAQGMGGKGRSGMAMMGQMKGMGEMQMPSALPGFAGASHIYHIGATSFFLDHSQHITLTQEQQIKLNQIKEKVLLGQATFDRWISQAEQELWVLTSSDLPDAAKIEAKIREVEKLNGDKRIAYIRAVGDAARVLTDEQRKTLVGTMLPNHDATSTGNQN